MGVAQQPVEELPRGQAARGANPDVGRVPASVDRESRRRQVRFPGDVPGQPVAFLLGGRSPVLLILGGAVAGWVALVLVGVIGVSFADGEYGFPAVIGTAVAIATGPLMYRLAQSGITA